MWRSKTKRLFLTLIVILAIDAFRTLFESVYFGIWYTSLAGWIPQHIGVFLMRPELVIIPKVLNVIAAVVVIVLLLKRWLPKEEEEQVRLGGALQESEEKFKALFEQAGDYILLLEVTEDKDLVIADANQAACDIHGYTHEEFLGMSIRDLDRGLDEEQVRDILDKLISGESFLFETVHQKKDGTKFSIEVSAKLLETGEDPPLILSIERDITDRKRADETFQAIVQSTVGRTGQDFFDNICIQLCKVFNSECAIVGELADPVTVKAIAMVLDGKPIKDFTCRLPGTPCGNLKTNGFCHYPENVCLLFPDSKNLQDMDAVGYAGTPLKNQNGTVIGVLFVISKNKMILPDRAEDLMNIIAAATSAEIERMKAEREKGRLEDRLQQAQKMEAIGTLAGGIAHDFNNILGTILGYADMAKEDAPPGTRFERDLEKVLIGANRAKDLVKQILAFSRQAQVERIPIKIQPLIKEGLKMLRSSIPATISITEDIDPKSGTILADPTQIHQVLMNLCTNAYHAMEETGGALSVTLQTTFVGSDEKEMLLHVNPGEYVELIVSDTGSGIRPDIIRKIFDPYFTTKETGKGTGMGLAIIHGIMSDYGGTIRVESRLGKGTTFHTYFPVVEKEALPEIKESEDIPQGKERILFIDDEELLVEMGKDMLERLGYHVTVRRTSLEALETFQNTPSEFDLVITDQTMPNMTGADLARRMMQIRPDIPIILCTGYSNLIDEDSAKALGIKEFALKPLSKEELAKLIRKVLNGAVK